MTIRAGEAWGEEWVVPEVVARCRHDADLATVDSDAITLGGDLWRALGCPGELRAGDPCTRVPLDRLACVIVTGAGTIAAHAVSHVRVGGWLARGRFVCLTNTGFLGEMNLAPRAHPNDGMFDVLRVEPDMSLRERLIARHRSLSGTHVPHPCITLSRATEWILERRGSERLFIDGHNVGDWSSVTVTIDPDALSVLI